jgi:hypothetical protein
MAKFDYTAPAELFTGRSIRGSRTMRYHRFDSGAEALRFAMETLPREQLLAAVLKVDETRYRHNDIHRFYEAKEYPLARKQVEVRAAPAAPQRKAAAPKRAPAKSTGKAAAMAAAR